MLCRPLGLTPERLLSIFADSSGGANVLKVRSPMIAAQIAGRDPGPVNFAVDGVCKDLRTMIAEAKALGATLPAAETVLKCFEEAARGGLAEKDQTALAANWVIRAGR